MPAPLPETDDAVLCAMLDRYVALLQAGQHRAAAEMLAVEPQLAPLAECLSALDGLAVAANGATSPAPPLDPEGTYIVPQGDDPNLVQSRAGALDRDFGRYELLEEVGRGGMGVVYRARQRDLNRVVALKMILASQLAGAEEVKRFYREARAAGQLRHPHIVGIHEVGQIHGQHYFAMEYIAGRSLAGLLKTGPIPAEQAARCLMQVARAVDYLHAHGVVHRDLKPSNILIDDAGVPYVTDFGLAKVFQEEDDRTQTGVILGTPGYMSPEQAAGRIAEISARSDVYSLGAILYEMLCGRPPFRDENPLNTILQVLESEPTRPNLLNPQVPPELERVCLRCLEKAPERRYASAAALADDLERYLRHEPLGTPPTGIRDRLRRWIRRETGLAARLAILGAAAAIVELRQFLMHRPWTDQLEVKLVFFVWTVLAFVFQWLLRRDRTAELARLAWAITDPVLLMITLNLAYGDFRTLLIGYPLLVAASGLWFSVRLVVVSTITCILSYAFLLSRRTETIDQPHYPVIFVASLAVIGFIVAYQVHRLRTLSRYFEQTQLPRPGS